MLRRISSTTIWLLIFGVLVAVQAYSTFGQTPELTGYWKNGSVGAISYFFFDDRYYGRNRMGRFGGSAALFAERLGLSDSRPNRFSGVAAALFELPVPRPPPKARYISGKGQKEIPAVPVHS